MKEQGKGKKERKNERNSKEYRRASKNKEWRIEKRKRGRKGSG